MRKFVILAVVVMALMVAAVVPVSAAPGATITGLVVNTANCTLTVTITVQDAGNYYVQIWDDFANKGAQGGPTAAGATVSYSFTIGPIGTVAPGIGVYVTDDPIAGNTFDVEDPYEPNFGSCSGSSWTPVEVSTAQNCATPRPAGYSVRSIPAGALAYFAADAATYTGFNIPAGMTWYTAATAENGFIKVWIACQANMVYVPVDNVIFN